MADKVSVIIPIYNVEKYVEECLISVMNQTLKEIEIICVNDGSKDHSMEIVHKYAQEDDRIVVIHQENQGLSAARNTGLDKAKGTYVLFLDSDDWILPNTLQELYFVAEKNELDDIYFNAEVFFDMAEEQESGYLNYYKRKKTYEGIYIGREFAEKIMKNGDFRPSACLQMIRREWLLENNLRFYEGIIHEDNLFTLQSMMLAEKVMFLDQGYYQRRVREDSIITTEKGVKNAVGYFVCIMEMGKFLIDKELEEGYYFEIENYLAWLKKKAISYVTGLKRQQVVEQLEGYSKDIRLNFMLHIYREVEYQKKILELQQQVEDYRTCNSYKIGRVVTMVPRKIKEIVKR